MSETFNFYNEVADKYPESDLVYATTQGKLRDAWLAPKLAALEGLTLDVGCDDGHYSAHIRDYVGVDWSKASLTKRWRTQKERIQGTAQSLPFGTGIFDNVVMSECLEHISERMAVLLEVRRVLKRGGRLIVTVPYGGNPFEIQWSPILESYGVKRHPYLHGGMDEPYLSTLLSFCGFTDIQTERPYDYQLGAWCRSADKPTQKRVLVAVPVKNQAKWLRRFLDSLDSIDYPKELLRFAFVEGYSDDGSWEMLQEWAVGKRVWFKRVKSIGSPEGRQQRLADIRNIIPDEALEKEDYIFWVDSDVMFAPNILAEMAKHSLPIVAPMVFIEGIETVFYDTCAFKKNGERFMPYPPYFIGFSRGLQSVDSVGACYLVASEIYEKGARYHGVEGGEPEHTAFCKRARELGYSVWLDSSLKVYHVNLFSCGVVWH